MNELDNEIFKNSFLIGLHRQQNWWKPHKQKSLGTSLVVQWLRLHPSNAGNVGSIPGRETKIPHATWHVQKKEKDSQVIHVYSHIWEAMLKKERLGPVRDKCLLFALWLVFDMK